MPIGISLRVTKKGKSLDRLSADLQTELSRARDDDLELIRRSMFLEAPSTIKGNKYSKNRIKRYLRAPSRCVRKIGRFSGYVFIDETVLPHVKYVIGGATPHPIPARYKPFLHFWWVKERRWHKTLLILEHPGRKPDDFLERAFIRAEGPVYNSTSRHIYKAVRMS